MNTVNGSFGSAPTIRLRTAFISDVHLGTKGCRADLLLDYLKSIQVDTLILVGDIIDVWSMRKSFYWPQEHSHERPSDVVELGGAARSIAAGAQARGRTRGLIERRT